MLGRLYLERNDATHAIEWLERAAEAPAPTPDAGRALLYDLAETLETVGEHARALAVFVELESESGGYRDVAGQIERLSKVAGSRLIPVQAAPLRRPPARNRIAPGADPLVGVLGAELFRRMVAGARRAPHQQLHARRDYRPRPGQRLGGAGGAADLFGSRRPPIRDQQSEIRNQQ